MDTVFTLPLAGLSAFARDIGAIARGYNSTSKYSFWFGRNDCEEYVVAYNLANLILPHVVAEHNCTLSGSLVALPHARWLQELTHKPSKDTHAHTGNRLEAMYLTLSIKTGYHANIVIVDRSDPCRPIVEHFEPNGAVCTLDGDNAMYDANELHTLLHDYLERVHPDCTLMPATAFCPDGGRAVQGRTGKQWCALFANLYLYLRAINPQVSPSQLHDFLVKVPHGDWNDIMEAFTNVLLEHALHHQLISHADIDTMVNSSKWLYNGIAISLYTTAMGVRQDFETVRTFLHLPHLRQVCDMLLIHGQDARIIPEHTSAHIRAMNFMLEFVITHPHNMAQVLYSYLSGATTVTDVETTFTEALITAIPGTQIILIQYMPYSDERGCIDGIVLDNRCEADGTVSIERRSSGITTNTSTAVEESIEVWQDKILAATRYPIKVMSDSFAQNIRSGYTLIVSHHQTITHKLTLVNPTLAHA